MTQDIQHLITERAELVAKQNWLGIRSERIQRRIREIDIVLSLNGVEAS